MTASVRTDISDSPLANFPCADDAASSLAYEAINDFLEGESSPAVPTRRFVLDTVATSRCTFGIIQENGVKAMTPNNVSCGTAACETLSNDPLFGSAQPVTNTIFYLEQMD